MGKLFLLIAAIATCHFLGVGKLVGIGGEPARDFTGEAYTQEGPITAFDRSGPIEFGLRFLDETQVDLITNGRKAGSTMTYKVKGDKMHVVHSCGEWDVDVLSDGRLYEREGERYYALNRN